jgi:hypothetical protein
MNASEKERAEKSLKEIEAWKALDESLQGLGTYDADEDDDF